MIDAIRVVAWVLFVGSILALTGVGLKKLYDTAFPAPIPRTADERAEKLKANEDELRRRHAMRIHREIQNRRVS